MKIDNNKIEKALRIITGLLIIDAFFLLLFLAALIFDGNSIGLSIACSIATVLIATVYVLSYIVSKRDRQSKIRFLVPAAMLLLVSITIFTLN